jgi:hypothetical protein
MVRDKLMMIIKMIARRASMSIVYVFCLPEGTWRMYYNNEADSKSIYYTDSPDLYNWTDSGKKVVGDQGSEGPYVSWWKGKAWMAVDNWKRLRIFFR